MIFSVPFSVWDSNVLKVFPEVGFIDFCIIEFYLKAKSKLQKIPKKLTESLSHRHLNRK
jgi:hypothetical protein